MGAFVHAAMTVPASAPQPYPPWGASASGGEYTPEHLQRILDAHSTTVTDSYLIEGANS
ncbi:hypothetical protein [uncultured Rothia sp.]|uniref:hypothetical protein n=1 Tax=uncultured Rothia sp. TaxID=316088 RepID=UPI0025F5B3DF|nr:hypothetical protein [uncultured Rothia sp.]